MQKGKSKTGTEIFFTVATLKWRYLMILLAIASPFAAARGQVSAPVREVVIQAIPGLQYDLKYFVVQPGEEVTLTLGNIDDMSHNLLVTKPGEREAVVNAALALAEKGPQMNYIPETANVLWSIPVISPGQTKSVTFTAPTKVGVYPYVCTYPGHGFIMFGEMRVEMAEAVVAGKTPVATAKPSVKPVVESPPSPNASHPYALETPSVYRVFIEGASPAAVAVGLPQQLSYCWDAGTCSLRFAWKGGFVDMTDLWKGHFDASAKVVGDIFFRDNTDYPLRLGERAEVPTVEYLGYRLVDDYPEFHYTINGLEVFELIREGAEGNGLIREFRIPNADQSVWFFTNRADDAIDYTSNVGDWEEGRLELSAQEAMNFTVTMSSYHLLYKKRPKK